MSKRTSCSGRFRVSSPHYPNFEIQTRFHVPKHLLSKPHSNDAAIIFRFDLRGSPRSCELGFFFPQQDQLTTSSFTFSGPGTFAFAVGSEEDTGAQEGVTTWHDRPPSVESKAWPKTVSMQPGRYYSFNVGKCTPGLASVTMTSMDTCFSWFQDFNPCAIGPYVTFDKFTEA